MSFWKISDYGPAEFEEDVIVRVRRRTGKKLLWEYDLHWGHRRGYMSNLAGSFLFEDLLTSQGLDGDLYASLAEAVEEGYAAKAKMVQLYQDTDRFGHFEWRKV